jgi:hypothetical protein
MPRDFDISPYFEIVKPTIVRGFDYLSLHWADKQKPLAEVAGVLDPIQVGAGAPSFAPAPAEEMILDESSSPRPRQQPRAPASTSDPESVPDPVLKWPREAIP